MASKINRWKLKEVYSDEIGIVFLGHEGMRGKDRSEVESRIKSIRVNLFNIPFSEIIWFGQMARKYANITIRPPT